MSSTLFEKSHAGRNGINIPKQGLADAPSLDNSLLRSTKAELPELSEFDVVRHFTKLSNKNFSIDLNFYPLGSCTMKLR